VIFFLNYEYYYTILTILVILQNQMAEAEIKVTTTCFNFTKCGSN